MGLSVDPPAFIKDWLAENWNAAGVGFTPTFTTSPYKKGVGLPQISVRDLPSRPEHLNLGSTYHFYYDICAIDIFDTDKDRTFKMKQEVRSIVYENQSNPTTTTYPSSGIEHILIYEEFPQSDYRESPPLLGWSIRVFVLYLETNT